MNRFRIFEVTSGPTPYPFRFVIEQDRPTTLDDLAALIRSSGALAVTVEAVAGPFDDIAEAHREATRLAEEHRAQFVLYLMPAPDASFGYRSALRPEYVASLFPASP